MRRVGWRGVASTVSAIVMATAIWGVGLADGLQAQEAQGDAAPAERSAEEIAADEAKAKAVDESLNAIGSVLDLQAAKRDEREALLAELEATDNEVDAERLKRDLASLDGEIEGLDAQIEALATGVSSAELDAADEAFDLNAELQDLIEPFLLMVKSATENAREIARLEQALDDAEDQHETAEEALDTLAPMISSVGEADNPVAIRLIELEDAWRARRAAADDRAATARRQLDLRLAAQTNPGEAAEEAVSTFVQERGRNLLFGVLAFAGVFFGMRLLRSGVITVLGPRRSRTFPARLGILLFDGVTVIASAGAVLAVFNFYNDWLLTGVAILLLIALGWLLLRSLPSLFEQITLLLNLGAVQEGERVMFNGAPWLVKRLDSYTDLENPALRGGSFTLPARELLGLHSRPMGADEAWFPTQEGDWVLIGEDVFGEVIFQSPEIVQVRQEGGAVITYTLEGFLEAQPRNLSEGYRAAIRFSLDYRHRDIALDTAPAALTRHVAQRLRSVVEPSSIKNVEASFAQAGPTALEFDLEADLDGAAAAQFEDVKTALAQFAVECSLANNWTMPPPHLTLQRA